MDAGSPKKGGGKRGAEFSGDLGGVARDLKSRHMREQRGFLGQMDVRTGRTSMQMYLESGAEIEETWREITAKRESGNWLGVMSGLFLVIVLF